MDPQQPSEAPPPNDPPPSSPPAPDPVPAADAAAAQPVEATTAPPSTADPMVVAETAAPGAGARAAGAAAPAPDPAAAAPTMPPSSPPPAAPPPMAPAPAPAVAVVPPAAPGAWQAAPGVSEPGPMPGVGFAPHAGRLIAYIIDAFIIGVVVTIVAIILTPLLVAGADSENTGAIVAAVFLYTFVVLLVSVSYFPFFWARGGQTPGMRFFRLRVVSDADGSRINGGTAVIRLIGLWISFLVFYLGIIWILVDKRRRGWHDLLAGTVVIHQP